MEDIKIYQNIIIESELNSVKNVTRRILKMDGNLVRLILASLICIVIGVASVIVPVAPTALFVIEDEAAMTPLAAMVSSFSGIALFGSFVCVFLPCISGFLCFTRKTVNGENPGFIEIFAPFTPRMKYGVSLLLPFVMLIRLVVVVLPVVGGIMNLPFFYEMSGQMSAFEIVADSAFILCLTIFAGCVGVYFSSYLFFVPYLVVSRKMKLFAAIPQSVRMFHKNILAVLKHVLSHTGKVLISLLSFLVLWMIYAAPGISVSYFVFCDKLFLDVTQADYE